VNLLWIPDQAFGLSGMTLENHPNSRPHAEEALKRGHVGDDAGVHGGVNS
jgi:hypothetical protein